MQHPADFFAPSIPVCPDHADVAELLGDLTTAPYARDDGGHVPDPSTARTAPRTPPAAHGRVLVAAAARPGEK
jgi:hypothetical protein